MKKNEPNISPVKKRVFSIVLAFMPLLLILVLELFLRLFNYGGTLDLFITGPEKQISHYWMGNPNLGERYFFRQKTKPAPPKDLFLKQKPENGYRIFVLGGSSAAGFPYGYNVMFSRILNFQLSRIFPNKHIEVVNTAMSAVNTYTLLDLMDEILEQNPDALLIYAGHNEFYGAMGVGSQEKLATSPKIILAYLKLKRFRTFLLVRDIVGALQNSLSKVTTGSTRIDPSNTLMARIVKEQSIPYKSDLYEKGVSQFEHNLQAILQKAESAGVPVIISDLVSNIKDQPPFVSAAADSFPTAEHAYRIGKKLLQQGDYAEAETALYLAKDLDALRFRASEEMNDIIYKTAQKYHIPIVRMKERFKAKSGHGIIGNELILEHLHPNIQGYFIMADAFLQAMKENHFIAENWDESRIVPMEDYQQDWGLTEIDTVYADYSIAYLKGGWPFKPAIMPNRALENFHPQTRVDSVAIRVLTESNFSIVVGHVTLAEYYESKKQYDKAFREYKAAYYCIPFELEFYEGAVRNLLYLRRFAQALNILEISHRYGSTAFLDKWTGQLYVSQDKFAEALPYLERARVSLADDQQLLRHLLQCYQSVDDKARAAELSTLLQVTAPSHEAAEQQAPVLDEQKKGLLYNALAKKAAELLQQKQYVMAMPLLRQAHAIKQTPFTYKWIGMLSLSSRHLEDAVNYLQAAAELQPEDFELHYNLCIALIHLKRKAEAQSILIKMEALRPGFKDPQKLREKIAAL